MKISIELNNFALRVLACFAVGLCAFEMGSEVVSVMSAAFAAIRP